MLASGGDDDANNQYSVNNTLLDVLQLHKHISTRHHVYPTAVQLNIYYSTTVYDWMMMKICSCTAYCDSYAILKATVWEELEVYKNNNNNNNNQSESVTASVVSVAVITVLVVIGVGDDDMMWYDWICICCCGY